MDNLRGRLGSTRKTKRGLGCNADSSTNFAGRYSKLMSGMDWEFSVAATSWSGDSMAYWPVSAPSNTAPHCYRNHGNPYIGKKARLRSQQTFFGGGETRESESLLTFGEISKLRHLASISIYE